MFPERNGLQIRKTSEENEINKIEASNMLVPSPELSWVLGVLSGGGNVRFNGIRLQSIRNPELLTEFSVVGQALFGKQPHVAPDEIYFFSSLIAQKIGNLRNNAWTETISQKHGWVLNNPKYTWKFIEGFFDTRAHLKTKPKYKGNTLRFRTNVFTNADFIKNLLLFVGLQKPTIFPDEEQLKETEYTVSVYNTKDLKIIADNIHPKSPALQGQMKAIKEEPCHSPITETDLYTEWVQSGMPSSSYQLERLYLEGKIKYSRGSYERILGGGSFREAIINLKKLGKNVKNIRKQIGEDERSIWTYAVEQGIKEKIIETGIYTTEELDSIEIYFKTGLIPIKLTPRKFVKLVDSFTQTVANLA